MGGLRWGGFLFMRHGGRWVWDRMAGSPGEPFAERVPAPLKMSLLTYNKILTISYPRTHRSRDFVIREISSGCVARFRELDVIPRVLHPAPSALRPGSTVSSPAVARRLAHPKRALHNVPMPAGNSAV